MKSMTNLLQARKFKKCDVIMVKVVTKIIEKELCSHH